VYTVEESKNDLEMRKIPGTRCKTLFLRDEHQRFYLVGLEGTKRLNIKELEKHLGVKKLRFGSIEELNREIGVSPGSVSVLSAIVNPAVIVILDKSLEKNDSLGFHPAKNTETYVFGIKDFIKLFNNLPNKKFLISL